MDVIRCAECEHVRLIEDWTRKQKALRCEDPRNGERWGWIVQIFPAKWPTPGQVPAPRWCHRREERENEDRERDGAGGPEH